MSFFTIQTMINSEKMDNLLKDFRIMRSDVPEGEACRIKFSNRSCGVPETAQKEIESIVFKINNGDFDNENEEALLKVLDLLTLYANHLDQQTSDKENPKPLPKIKEEKVLRWLEAAYKVAKTLVPELDSLITAETKDKLLTLKPEVLSSVSLTLHYLGKARRYNPEIHVKERLPLLTAALSIGRHLETCNDLHYYSARVATFEMPVVFSLRDLKMYKEAAQIIEMQLQKSYESKNRFHMIQGHVQLAEIMREQYEAEHNGIGDSIKHARQAMLLVEESAKISGAENFTKHCIYFNARVAAMKAYHCSGDKELAYSMAQAISSEYEQDLNCGAKPWHIDAAKEILSPSVSLSL